LHHRDVIRIALRRLNHDVHSDHADDVVKELESEMEEQPPAGISTEEDRAAE
jgi:hypothetical protein